MLFALGFIAGLLMASFVGIILIYSKFELFLDKTMSKLVQKKVTWPIKESIEILEPIPLDIEAMEKVFEENDKKGRDTKMSELDAENL